MKFNLFGYVIDVSKPVSKPLAKTEDEKGAIAAEFRYAVDQFNESFKDMEANGMSTYLTTEGKYGYPDHLWIRCEGIKIDRIWTAKTDTTEY